MAIRNKAFLFGACFIFYMFTFSLMQLRSLTAEQSNDEIKATENNEPLEQRQKQDSTQLPLHGVLPTNHQRENKDWPQKNIDFAQYHDQPRNTDEKFITFFTHSGFQNQLIQVENGILLAWYLNRTLILPRAVLGVAFGWNYFEKLQLEHMLRDPLRENETLSTPCDVHARSIIYWEIECPDTSLYTTIPFDDIFDLSWAKKHVRIVLRERSDLEWLEQKYGIHRAGVTDMPNGSYVDGDILFFKGETRYDWRIFDTARKTKPLGKYADSLNIYDLRKRKEKLIHFSSLFGTGRLPIRRPEHYEFLRTLQRSIIYRHPAVLDVASKITEILGGAGNYVGLHIRSNDGWFVKALPQNIIGVISEINIALRTRQLQLLGNQTMASETTIDLHHCLNLAKSNATVLLYMATDAHLPRSNPSFNPIWEQFPCTFTMGDLLAPDSPVWESLDQVIDERTGNSIRKFLLPLVDATVASRGWIFVGSKGSTFSGYITRLHEVYWATAKSQA